MILSVVMAGPVPAIHVLLATRKTWMPATGAGMTWRGGVVSHKILLHLEPRLLPHRAAVLPPERRDERERGAARVARRHHAGAIGRVAAERLWQRPDHAHARDRHDLGSERHAEVGLALGDAARDLAAIRLRHAFLLDGVGEAKLGEHAREIDAGGAADRGVAECNRA